MKRLVVILAAALALCGCLPVTSTSPVGSTAGFKPDAALFGMWQGTGNDDSEPGSKGAVFLAILPGAESDATAVLISMPLPVKSGDWSTYALTMAALGPYRYLNARPVITNGNPEDAADTKTFPLLYRIDADGTLTLYLIDEDAAKVAVKTGKIAGTVGNSQYGDVVLTAPPTALDAFFARSAGRALFRKPLVVLHKVT